MCILSLREGVSRADSFAAEDEGGGKGRAGLKETTDIKM